MERKIRKPNSTNYATIHWYLGRFKKGICEECKREGKTQLAKKHDKQHERKLENYKELCPKCHLAYDRTETREVEWLDNLSKTYSHRNRIKPKICGHCNEQFTPRRKTSCFCSNKCSAQERQAPQRDRDSKGQFMVSVK